MREEEGKRKEKGKEMGRETTKGKGRGEKENVFPEKQLNTCKQKCQKRIARMVKPVRKLRLCCRESQGSRDLQ